MTRQRLTKRQIKEDPLVTWVGKARTWATLRARRLLVITAAVIIAAAAVTAMRSAQRRAEEDATTQLAQAQYHLWNGNDAQAIDLANQLRQRWPGTRSARRALLVKADALLGSQQPREALDAYREFLQREKRDGLRRGAARRGAAVALEDSGQYGEAAREYEHLARQIDRGPLVAQDLASAARCHARAGSIDAARAIYEELLQDYPELERNLNVQIKLRELDAGTAGAAGSQG